MRSPIGSIGITTLLALAALTVGGCGSAGGATGTGATPAEISGEWVLVTMGDPDDPAPVSTDRLTTIAFAEGEVTGAGPCNRYRAAYSLDGAKLAVGQIAATAALCGDPELDVQEAKYLLALESAQSLTIESDGTLTIDYGSGRKLRYRSA